jgi:hypothetical protein
MQRLGLQSSGIELQKSAREFITSGNVDWGYSEKRQEDTGRVLWANGKKR